MLKPEICFIEFLTDYFQKDAYKSLVNDSHAEYRKFSFDVRYMSGHGEHFCDPYACPFCASVSALVYCTFKSFLMRSRSM